MHTIVITLKAGMPIFPYSIKYDNELIHYRLHNDSELYKVLYPGKIAEIKFVSITALNMSLRTL